jgi:integrase
MASIRRRGKRWFVEVYVAGKRRARSHDSKAAAAAWALRMESELRAEGPPAVTLGAACERYRIEVAPLHRGERWERVRLRMIERDAVAGVLLSDLAPAQLADWRDRRLQQVAPASVLRELKLLHGVLESCRRDWGLIEVNPLADVRKPTAPAPRRRRVPDAVIDAMVAGLGYARGLRPRLASQRVAVAMLLAVETAMRSGELLALTWADVGARSVTLPRTKNGDRRQVPLSTAARGLLDLLGPGEPAAAVVGVKSGSRDALWRKGKAKAAKLVPHLADVLADLHFHDLRAEAIWRLSKRLEVLELARMIGHRDLKSLLIYYAASADELADKLG